MSSDKLKQLEQYFNKATSETVVNPDTQLFIEICNIINSRADMPKHAVAIIKKRMISTRNPKVIFLCLEFLEVAANACELNFQSQVATKDFMSVLNAFINREIDKTVLDKLVHLTKYWIQVYGSFKDILPGIFAFAEALEKKGVALPSHVESPYAYLLKTKKTTQVTKPDYDEGPTEPRSHSSIKSTNQFPSSNQPTGGFSGKGILKSAPKGVNPKLKKDLDVVRQNIQLTNEMIDAQDPKEDPKNNDVLTDLVQTLKGMENKLRDFIQKQNDEETMNFLLEINDDLNKTFDRYKAIRRGDKPKPFIPADVQYSIEREDPSKIQSKPQSQRPKPSAQDDLLDLLGDTNLNQGQKGQATNTAMSKAEVQNLFDLDFSPSPQTSNTSAQGFNTAQPSFNSNVLTGAQQTTQNTQQQQQQQQPQTNTAQNFASQISSLYKTANQPSANQFATAPTTGGFGNMGGNAGGNMNMGGSTMGGNMGGNFGGMQSQGFSGGFQNANQGQGGNFSNQNMGMSNMNTGGMGFSTQQGGMSGGYGMGYGNFNTATTGNMSTMTFGNQNQGQFGGGAGNQNQGQFNAGSFNTANPMGYGGGFGGGMNAGMGTSSMGGGFNQQQMGNFNTMPIQSQQQSNAFDMSGMQKSLPQQQTQQTQVTTQQTPFDDLI